MTHEAPENRDLDLIICDQHFLLAQLSLVAVWHELCDLPKFRDWHQNLEALVGSLEFWQIDTTFLFLPSVPCRDRS